MFVLLWRMLRELMNRLLAAVVVTAIQILSIRPKDGRARQSVHTLYASHWLKNVAEKANRSDRRNEWGALASQMFSFDLSVEQGYKNWYISSLN